jgi:hypothetical protein
MRYLMLKRCDSIYDYIPLESIVFHFIEVDEHEYRVEISYGGHSDTIFEKRYFGTPTIYGNMRNLSMIPDGAILTPSELFE